MAVEASSRPDPDVERLVHDAKEPVTVAAGPYGHPFHPILVTIPIGAWVASVVFDVASRLSENGSPALVEGSYWLIGLGVLGALAAALFGFLDLLTIPRRTRAFTVGLTHMGLNLLVTAAFAANFLWRRDDYREVAEVSGGQLALSLAAIAFLMVSGFLGGTLSYRYGVRVAREDTQAEGYRQRAARS